MNFLCKKLPPELLVKLAASSPLGAGPKTLLRNALVFLKMSGMKAAMSDRPLNSQHFTDQADPYQNRHLGFKRVL